MEAPKQRNTKEENEQIKAGNGKNLWNPEEGDSESEKARKKHKKFHKDVDARWTKKRGENHYGYKNHVKADKKTKLIEKYHTTDASVQYFPATSYHQQGITVPIRVESLKTICQ